MTQLGVLSTKVRTLRHEEATIPNAVVVSQTTTDYSRFGDTEGVFTPTSVTIGYDTPWRQVHSLLLLAAERTRGPAPLRRIRRCCRTSLEDFYVKCTLWSVWNGRSRGPIILACSLHANIQDLFNEYGVQIMSPNYVVDPAAPKVVPGQRLVRRTGPPRRDAGRYSTPTSSRVIVTSAVSQPGRLRWLIKTWPLCRASWLAVLLASEMARGVHGRCAIAAVRPV